MGRILIDHVVSFSSQDPRFPVENLLVKNPNSVQRGWLCASNDKSGQLEVEFQLEKASHINYIDIGNDGSSTVEILVGSSSWPRSRPFVTLLPAVTVMSLYESKKNINKKTVKMFNSDHLDSDSVKSKWDRVKVICCQPYRKDCQFGLMFLRFTSNKIKRNVEEQELEITPNKDLSKSLMNYSKLRNGLNSPFQNFYSRGNKMVQAAKAKSSPVQAAKVRSSPVIEDVECLVIDNVEESHQFELDITLFLSSKSEEVPTPPCKDLIKEYMEKNGGQMSKYHNVLFCKAYKQVLENNNLVTIIPIPPLTPSVTPKKTNRHFSPMFCNGSSPGDFAFDVNFTPKSSRTKPPQTPPSSPADSFSNSLVLNGYDAKLSGKTKRKSSESLFESSLKPSESKKPKKLSLRHLRKEDFVQPDGRVPSTSKQTTHMDCPICHKEFLVSEIETHAAICDDWADVERLNSDSDEEFVDFRVPLRQTSSPELFSECPSCGDMYSQQEVKSHVISCMNNLVY